MSPDRRGGGGDPLPPLPAAAGAAGAPGNFAHAICPTFLAVTLEKTCFLGRSDHDLSRPFFRQKVSLILTQHLEVPKQPGAAGAPGAPRAPAAPGADGAPGAAGARGAAGADGADGAPGTLLARLQSTTFLEARKSTSVFRQCPLAGEKMRILSALQSLNSKSSKNALFHGMVPKMLAQK